jgi:RNA polymerase sigma-70 factor (ECF subfamily)
MRLARAYEQLKHELLTVCVHLAGERAAGEDLLHDVFVSVARLAASTPLPPTSDELRRYLVTSCIHRARDLKRRRAESLDDRGALDRAESRDDDPAARASSGDDAGFVRAALLALPEEQREVVTLHLHGGLKFREIAEATGVPLDTTTSRYRYALEKLRHRLGARGASPRGVGS